MFLEVFSSGPIGTNSLLLACTKTGKAAVFDVPLGSAALVEKRIQEKGFSLEKIFLTHSHWDHIAEVALLKRKSHAQVFVHENDAKNLEKPGADRLALHFPIEGVHPDGFLTEGETLFIGELEIKVIHTPGHTPGGVCFYLEKEKVLISGDTLFRGTIGSLDLPTGQPELMIDSLKKLAALPPDVTVYPGHGDKTTIEKERSMIHAIRLKKPR